MHWRLLAQHNRRLSAIDNKPSVLVALVYNILLLFVGGCLFFIKHIEHLQIPFF
jgi:hypothetical protein